ncbi:MAG: tetratricopeptide repeat protein [Verrucomicrobia bacterium]|jgi:hypothetical protein|nr:tetratricopeptide repeat protein [Verrucomicrobiota bacterium]
MRSGLVLVLTVGWLRSVHGAATDSAAFEQANQLYEEGRYQEAIGQYEALATRHSSGAVHFNLGNAYFKSGQLGEALAHYLQAERFSPRDPDVAANLRFARERVTGPSYKPGWFARKAQSLTGREWAAAATAAVWLFFGLLSAGQLQRGWRPLLRPWTGVAGTLAAAVVATALWVAHFNADRPVAVVTQREAVMRLGPLEESQSAGTLQDGAELRILDRKDTWVQVTADGRQRGWLPSAAVQEIQP